LGQKKKGKKKKKDGMDDGGLAGKSIEFNWSLATNWGRRKGVGGKEEQV